MTNLIAARSIQDIERDQHEMSQKFEKLKDISNIGGKARADISIYGQESNDSTWRLAKMNPAIRGIDDKLAHGDIRTLDSITSTSFVKPDWERSCLV